MFNVNTDIAEREILLVAREPVVWLVQQWLAACVLYALRDAAERRRLEMTVHTARNAIFRTTTRTASAAFASILILIRVRPVCRCGRQFRCRVAQNELRLALTVEEALVSNPSPAHA